MYRSNYKTYENYENSETQQENSASEQPQAPKNHEQELLSLENVVVLSNYNHKQNLLKSHPNILVYIYADWCGPCKHLKPTLVELMKNNTHVVLLMENMERQITKGVKGIPFFEYHNNNSLVLNKTGSHDFEKNFDKFFS
tara:strand:- start:669 stop:1088 length:420 start_codon:yes stop_codon:yes gene_type:complete